MATAYPTPAPTPQAAARGGARWLPVITAAAVTSAFAFLAFRLSFAALTALAEEHGVEPDVVWMFAVQVDGGAVVGTVGVAMAKHTGRSTRPYWGTVIGFAALSLGFNVQHSDGTPAGIAIAVTPPIAQLVATELLVRMLPSAGAAAPATTTQPVATALAAADRASVAAREASAAAIAARTAAADTAAAASAAVDAAQQVAAGGTAAAVPPQPVDLAALIATVDDEPPAPAALDAAPPPPVPLAATFAAPPAAASEAAAGEPPPAAPVSPEWVEAYRSVEVATGKRPTQEALGTALGLGRTRGSEIRAAVEEVLEAPCAVTIS